ncbi:hypothetical protein B0T20DRAFT_392381 [Sordaria brevicollis]|uniref:Uncharacterized protein n=1 Tax=Sordaria brevicollis TaxID=83679 RepID=A0AAE0PGA9_SORBR|nr:hypothetical protein B0T20DRAFT_392381 [Sordaria brevicollis]
MTSHDNQASITSKDKRFLNSHFDLDTFTEFSKRHLETWNEAHEALKMGENYADARYSWWLQYLFPIPQQKHDRRMGEDYASILTAIKFLKDSLIGYNLGKVTQTLANLDNDAIERVLSADPKLADERREWLITFLWLFCNALEVDKVEGDPDARKLCRLLLRRKWARAKVKGKTIGISRETFRKEDVFLKDDPVTRKRRPELAEILKGDQGEMSPFRYGMTDAVKDLNRFVEQATGKNKNDISVAIGLRAWNDRHDKERPTVANESDAWKWSDTTFQLCESSYRLRQNIAIKEWPAHLLFPDPAGNGDENTWIPVRGDLSVTELVQGVLNNKKRGFRLGYAVGVLYNLRNGAQADESSGLEDEIMSFVANIEGLDEYLLTLHLTLKLPGVEKDEGAKSTCREVGRRFFSEFFVDADEENFAKISEKAKRVRERVATETSEIGQSYCVKVADEKLGSPFYQGIMMAKRDFDGKLGVNCRWRALGMHGWLQRYNGEAWAQFLEDEEEREQLGLEDRMTQNEEEKQSNEKGERKGKEKEEKKVKKKEGQKAAASGVDETHDDEAAHHPQDRHHPGKVYRQHSRAEDYDFDQDLQSRKHQSSTGYGHRDHNTSGYHGPISPINRVFSDDVEHLRERFGNSSRPTISSREGLNIGNKERNSGSRQHKEDVSSARRSRGDHVSYVPYGGEPPSPGRQGREHRSRSRHRPGPRSPSQPREPSYPGVQRARNRSRNQGRTEPAAYGTSRQRLESRSRSRRRTEPRAYSRHDPEPPAYSRQRPESRSRSRHREDPLYPTGTSRRDSAGVYDKYVNDHLHGHTPTSSRETRGKGNQPGPSNYSSTRRTHAGILSQDYDYESDGYEVLLGDPIPKDVNRRHDGHQSDYARDRDRVGPSTSGARYAPRDIDHVRDRDRVGPSEPRYGPAASRREYEVEPSSSRSRREQPTRTSGRQDSTYGEHDIPEHVRQLGDKYRKTHGYSPGEFTISDRRR